MEVLAQKKSLKRADVTAACKKALGEDIPPVAFGKVIKELATVKANVWTFKTGSGSEDELIETAKKEGGSTS